LVDTLAIGAHEDTIAGERVGCVYVYTKKKMGWRETQKICAEDKPAGAGFGSAVAVVGEVMPIKVKNHDDRGGKTAAAYI